MSITTQKQIMLCIFYNNSIKVDWIINAFGVIMFVSNYM